MEYSLPENLRPDIYYQRFIPNQCYAKLTDTGNEYPYYTYLGNFIKDNKNATGAYNRNSYNVYTFTEGTANETDRCRTIRSCSATEVDNLNQRIQVVLKEKQNRITQEKLNIAAKYKARNEAAEKNKVFDSLLQSQLVALGYNATIEHALYDASVLLINIRKGNSSNVLKIKYDTKTKKLIEPDFMNTFSINKKAFPQNEVERIRHNVKTVIESHYGNKIKNFLMEKEMRPPQNGNEGGILFRSARNRFNATMKKRPFANSRKSTRARRNRL